MRKIKLNFCPTRNTLDDIDWTEFALATRGVRSPKEVTDNIGTGQQTALRGNAAILSKQANKYSRFSPVIVLFNYQNMIVLDFFPGGRRFDNRRHLVQYLFSNGQAMPHKALLLAAFMYGMGKRAQGRWQLA